MMTLPPGAVMTQPPYNMNILVYVTLTYLPRYEGRWSCQPEPVWPVERTDDYHLWTCTTYLYIEGDDLMRRSRYYPATEKVIRVLRDAVVQIRQNCTVVASQCHLSATGRFVRLWVSWNSTLLTYAGPDILGQIMGNGYWIMGISILSVSCVSSQDSLHSFITFWFYSILTCECISYVDVYILLLVCQQLIGLNWSFEHLFLWVCRFATLTHDFDGLECCVQSFSVVGSVRIEGDHHVIGFWPLVPG